MSKRRRIARTTVQVLTILGIGSIVTALLIGTSSIGPKNAFAAVEASNSGALGVSERTIAPLTVPVASTVKVPAEQSVSPTSVAALAVPAVKRTSTTAQFYKAPRRLSVPSVVSIGRAMLLGGWQRAKVSWYGPGFYGRQMAGGGKLRRNSMVVAHKRLPFGTKIIFTHKGRSVVATVRDRGPYVSGRQFDLGPGTARALRFQGVGVLRYKIISKGTGKINHKG